MGWYDCSSGSKLILNYFQNLFKIIFHSDIQTRFAAAEATQRIRDISLAQKPLSVVVEEACTVLGRAGNLNALILPGNGNGLLAVRTDSYGSDGATDNLAEAFEVSSTIGRELIP